MKAIMVHFIHFHKSTKNTLLTESPPPSPEEGTPEQYKESCKYLTFNDSRPTANQVLQNVPLLTIAIHGKPFLKIHMLIIPQ